MKNFEYYLNTNDVRKVSKDLPLAKSLNNDAKERAIKALKLNTKEFAKFIFENIYDSLREFCDALLAAEGFKSYSHEASISYLKKYNLDDSLILALDHFRYKRNGSKYYGKEITIDDAEEIKKFYHKNLDKLLKILKRVIGNN